MSDFKPTSSDKQPLFTRGTPRWLPIADEVASAARAARRRQLAVLGCTELPLLVDPPTAPLPVFDSTRLLARAALREALA